MADVVSKSIDLKPEDIVVIPTKDAVTADKLWYLRIIAQFPGPAMEGNYVAEYCPMTSDGVLVQRDSVGQDTTRRMETQEFFADSAKCPGLKAVMDALIDNTKEIEAYLIQKTIDKAAEEVVEQ